MAQHRQAQRLKRQREALGAVNLRAEEEAQEYAGRLETMRVERADLLRYQIREIEELDPRPGEQQLLHDERDRYPAFRIPLMCVPASIDNNLPIYPAMYCDEDFGLHHLCSWENDVDHVERLRGKPLTRANGVKPLVLEMHDPYINLAIPVIERHVDAMWRTHNLPTLKRHEQLATV